MYRVGLISSGFYKVLSEKDLSGFYRQVYTSLGIILAVAFVSKRDILFGMKTEDLILTYFADQEYKPICSEAFDCHVEATSDESFA